MTIGKIKLTQEQADAIELYKVVNPTMHHFLKYKDMWSDTFVSLKGFSTDEFARLMYQPNSYEVEPAFKVGEWVINTHGTLGKIESVDGDNYIGEWVYPVEVGMYTTKRGISRHATPEEIKAEKERRIWAKIGRKVGEIKEDDIYYDKNGFIYLAKLNQGIRIDEASIAEIKNRIKEGKGKGFYPAESFISLEDGGEE